MGDNTEDTEKQITEINKLSELRPGMQIEDVAVARDVPKYGVILKIDSDSRSPINGAKLPVIIGFETKDHYIKYLTDMDHKDFTWVLTGKTVQINQSKFKKAFANKDSKSKKGK